MPDVALKPPPDSDDELAVIPGWARDIRLTAPDMPDAFLRKIIAERELQQEQDELRAHGHELPDGNGNSRPRCRCGRGINRVDGVLPSECSRCRLYGKTAPRVQTSALQPRRSRGRASPAAAAPPSEPPRLEVSPEPAIAEAEPRVVDPADDDYELPDGFRSAHDDSPNPPEPAPVAAAAPLTASTTTEEVMPEKFCPVPGCGRKLRIDNSRGACSRCMAAGRFKDGVVINLGGMPVEPAPATGQPPARDVPASDEDAPLRILRRRFETVAIALGKNPDTLLEPFMRGWLERIERAAAGDADGESAYGEPTRAAS